MKDDSSNDQDIKIVNPQSSGAEDNYPSSKDEPKSSNLKATPIIPNEFETIEASNTIDNGEGDKNETFSSVAVGTRSKRFLIIAIILAAIIAMYFIFRNIRDEAIVEKTPSEKIKERSEKEAKELIKNSKPLASVDQEQITQSPKLPAPLPIQAPQPPAPPPPPVPLSPQSPVFPQLGNQIGGGSPSSQIFSPGTSDIVNPFASNEDEKAKLKALEARRKSSIMVLGGGGSDASVGKDKDKDAKDKPKEDKTTFLGFGEGSFGESSIGKTKASQVKATYIGRLDNLVAEGKLIHAVLETAINTDLPGLLRAVVARDVYGESGRAVLIPKGSRIIGTYQAEVKPGHNRVAVAWDRVIRPDGVDIAINSPGTDVLGRAGVSGFLDNKFLTKLGNALLISYVVPSVANKIFNGNANQTPITTTSSVNAATGITSTSSTSTFKQQQLKESQDKFNEVMSKAIQDSFTTAPTIFIDQGTEVNIFVNKDLIFPDEAIIGGSKLIR